MKIQSSKEEREEKRPRRREEEFGLALLEQHQADDPFTH